MNQATAGTPMLERSSRRFWTDAEREELRRLYPTMTASALARWLNRSKKGIYTQAREMGLMAATPRWSAADTEVLRRRHADGWSDQEIGAEIGHERHTVARHRRRLGLPMNRFSAHCRAKVATRTQAQCKAAGVPSLAMVRRQAFDRYASENGWPSDLRPRHVHILNLLAANGPMTRRAIADALGLSWPNSRAALKSNDPEGSYLAHLTARGLVVNLGKIARGQGRGRSCCIYSLTLTTERSPICGSPG